MTPTLLSNIRHRDACNVENMNDARQCDKDRYELLKYARDLEAALWAAIAYVELDSETPYPMLADWKRVLCSVVPDAEAKRGAD